MVTALWASEDAYRGWVDDPWRAENAERHAGVFEAMELTGGGGSLYEVVSLRGARSGDPRLKAVSLQRSFRRTLMKVDLK